MHDQLLSAGCAADAASPCRPAHRWPLSGVALSVKAGRAWRPLSQDQLPRSPSTAGPLPPASSIATRETCDAHYHPSCGSSSRRLATSQTAVGSASSRTCSANPASPAPSTRPCGARPPPQDSRGHREARLPTPPPSATSSPSKTPTSAPTPTTTTTTKDSTPPTTTSSTSSTPPEQGPGHGQPRDTRRPRAPTRPEVPARPGRLKLEEAAASPDFYPTPGGGARPPHSRGEAPSVGIRLPGTLTQCARWRRQSRRITDPSTKRLVIG